MMHIPILFSANITYVLSAISSTEDHWEDGYSPDDY